MYYSENYNNKTEWGNTVVGTQALVNNTAGNNNTVIGYQSSTNVSGSSNVVLGASTAGTLTSGTNNIYIGSGADASTSTSTGEIVIGISVIGKGSNIAFISATSALYYSIPAFGYFQYAGTNTNLNANTALPFATVNSKSGNGTVGNSSGVITMGILAWYRITFSCLVSPAFGSVGGEAFYIYKNAIAQTFTYTDLNAPNTTNIMNCIIQLTNTTDTISVSYNQTFNFGTSTCGFMSIDWISS